MKIVLSLSGGMDSTSLLGILLEQGHSVYPVCFKYGSKHNPYELTSAVAIQEFYRKYTDLVKPMTYIDLTQAFESFESNLLLSGDEIPEGHYEEESMKATVVPGRNTIFISFMLGLAQSFKADAIALGVHSGDHHIYPDCRKEYIHAFQQVVRLVSEDNIILYAPLITYNKTAIIEEGLSLTPPVPYKLTRTCYKDQELSCGKCGSCTERLEAFRNNNIIDPIKYE